MPSALKLDALTRTIGPRDIVHQLTLEIAPGSLLALVGASGSGKTTTLRMTAGYDTPDSGRVLLDGQDITALPPQRRDFGMVFQHYALFPHLRVGENVAFGLEARGVNRADRETRAAAALQTVGLAGATSRTVQSLSGGEQQRVALARALVIEPRVLLLDEPLSNLDPTLRRGMRDELRAMLRRLGVTALFVTHDQEDAFAVADRVALLAKGELLQQGTPEELYDAPASRAVAEFIGRATIVPATSDGTRVSISIGGVTHAFAARGAARGDVLAILRPESLALAATGSSRSWPGVVTARRFAGGHVAYCVRIAPTIEVELATGERAAREGDTVSLTIAREPVAVVAP
jgi:ABC-type Fe3+/spermidine/putrescine transport system ATPase subunit